MTTVPEFCVDQNVIALSNCQTANSSDSTELLKSLIAARVNSRDATKHVCQRFNRHASKLRNLTRTQCSIVQAPSIQIVAGVCNVQMECVLLELIGRDPSFHCWRRIEFRWCPTTEVNTLKL